MKQRVFDILPHLLLDSVLQVYSDVVSKIPMKQELKQWRNKFRNQFSLVNRYNFSKHHDTDKIIDLMDELNTVINNELTLITVQLMKPLESLDFKYQTNIVALYKCYLITLTANMIVYSKEKKMDVWLDSLSKCAYKLCNLYVSTITDITVNPNNDEYLVSLINSLIEKSITWSYSKGEVDL